VTKKVIKTVKIENEELYSEFLIAPSETLAVDVKCNDCVFFKKMSRYGQPCVELGRDPESNPCGDFTPDFRAVSKNDISSLMDGIRILGNLKNPNSLIVFMLNAQKISRKGFKPGQEVWFSIESDSRYQTLDTWYQGCLVGVHADKLTAFTQEGLTATLRAESFLNSTQWALKRPTLPKKKREKDKISTPVAQTRLRMISQGKPLERKVRVSSKSAEPKVKPLPIEGKPKTVKLR
jgi:hypothetical protein